MGYGKINLLKTGKVFFTKLGTTAAVKIKAKRKQSIMKNITIQNIQNEKSKLQNKNLSREVYITLWHWLFW